MNIISARNPQWADVSNTHINLEVLFEGIGAYVPFSASASDCEAHGVTLFNSAVAGEFGPIALYVEPVKTPEQIIAELETAVQEHLNASAKARGYDDIKSAAIRAGYPGPFHDEGIAYATWMDSCWAHCYQVMAAVQSGTRAIPTAEELVAELPLLVLP